MASVEQLELCLLSAEDELNTGDRIEPRPTACSSLMARVLDSDNLMRALKQVKHNKNAPGVDGLTVDAFPAYPKCYWVSIRDQLLAGTYRPKPVRRVGISKPDGRRRTLGIPTVLDRFIQQAIAQVLQADWEEAFHTHSYGFRPGRSAHQAIHHAQATIQSGHRWVVDCDLDAFFDRVNHDVLMTRLKQRTREGDVLRLIIAF